jgi:peptidoglycan/LPS O-acetylase OafA/YrhL
MRAVSARGKAHAPEVNNFNFLRLIAAAAVILHHAYDLTGRSGYLDATVKVSIGWMAVSVFFSMSGYLIFLSAERSRSVLNFMYARALRIFPGLIAMLVLTTFVLGALFSDVPANAFFLSGETYSYIFGNSILYLPKYVLPGVFAGNSINAVNGSLWTLRFEFTCYLFAGVAIALGIVGRKKLVSALLIGVGLGYAAIIVWAATVGSPAGELFNDAGDVQKLFRLTLAFYVGAVVANFRLYDRLGVVASLAALAILVLSYTTEFYFPAMIVALAIWAFWLAKIGGPIADHLRKVPDFSYGLYIYSFPIQQALLHLKPDMGIVENSSLALVLTSVIALASWFIVEKPALKMKRVVG